MGDKEGGRPDLRVIRDPDNQVNLEVERHKREEARKQEVMEWLHKQNMEILDFAHTGPLREATDRDPELRTQYAKLIFRFAVWTGKILDLAGIADEEWTAYYRDRS